MNEYQKPLLDKPSITREDTGGRCAICGRWASDEHHVIPKGMGGLPSRVERRIPRIVLCGSGNMSGCHGLWHQHKLHFRWSGGWEYLVTEEPMDYAKALRVVAGWQRIEVPDEIVFGRK